jgi:hypothetical protein
MGRIDRLFGNEPREGETREGFVRRLNSNRPLRSGDMTIALPALVDLYDEIQSLRGRVERLESRP